MFLGDFCKWRFVGEVIFKDGSLFVEDEFKQELV